MQFRHLWQIAAIGSILPRSGRYVAFISSGTLAVLGIRHFFFPTNFAFSMFLFFNFISMLPMAVLLSILLYGVSFWRRMRKRKLKGAFLRPHESIVFGLMTIMMMSLIVGASFFVYFYLGYKILGTPYLLLSIVYLCPVFWLKMKQTSKYIVTLLALFLVATLLTWIFLFLNIYIFNFPFIQHLEHMKQLPTLGEPDMVFMQMSFLFIITNSFAAYEIFRLMTKGWNRTNRQKIKTERSSDLLPL